MKCEYCGNQRRAEARESGLSEGTLEDLLNFESSPLYDERPRAALSYAEAITWRLNPDDAFWERLHGQFTEEELVELACFISLTMGQQSWIRLLNINATKSWPEPRPPRPRASRTPRSCTPRRPGPTTGRRSRRPSTATIEALRPSSPDNLEAGINDVEEGGELLELRR